MSTLTRPRTFVRVGVGDGRWIRGFIRHACASDAAHARASYCRCVKEFSARRSASTKRRVDAVGTVGDLRRLCQIVLELVPTNGTSPSVLIFSRRRLMFQ